MTGFWKSLFLKPAPELTPAQRQQQEFEYRKYQWRSAIKTRDQCFFDLQRLYVKYADKRNVRLPTEYLGTFLNIVADIYEKEFPVELPEYQQDRNAKKIINPDDAYVSFLRIFLDALIAFTEAFPAEAQLPLNTKPSTFTRLLPIFTPDKQDFLPGIWLAFLALRRKLQEDRQQCDQHGVFDWNNMFPYAWDEFDEPKPKFYASDYYESEPIYGDAEDRRRWRRDKRDFDLQQKHEKQLFEEHDIFLWETRKKRHDKAHKDIRERTLPWQTTLHGTPLHSYIDQLVPNISVPYALPLQKRFGGHYIIAPSGLGKTTLLTAMILDDIQQVLAGRMSIVVMDPKGELTDIIKRLAVFSRNDKLVLIEPEDNIAINPFDLNAGSIDHTVDAINYIFSSFAEELTELQGTLLRPTIRALLIGYPNPTLDTLQRLLAGGLKQENGKIVGPFVDFAKNHPDEDLRSFLLTEFTNETVYRETKGQVLRRLRSLRENQIIKQWFFCQHTRFDLSKEIEASRVIVINNSRELLTERGAEFFGRFFIAQLRAAGERRKTNDSNNLPTFLYIDECDQVIKTDNNIETYIDKLRSKNIGIILAHRRLYHFDGNKATLDALLNAPIRFASADDDAEALAKRLRVSDPAELRFPEPGYFAAYVRQHRPETAVLRVDKPPLKFMSDAELNAIRVKMRNRYAFSHQKSQTHPFTGKETPSPQPPAGDTSDPDEIG